LRQALTLIGEGREVTEVVTEQGEYVLRYEGNGLFGLFELTVRYVDAGVGAADVVNVSNGEVHIEHCQFSGAMSNDKQFGAGLKLMGSTRGEVRGCLVKENGFGIYLGEQVQPTLEGNTCRENKQSGIGYFGSAAGVARQSICTGNMKNGIYVGEQAQPTLEGNTCRENERSGIGYFGSAAGVARQNTCTGNMSYHGISVNGQAQPTLEGNTCRENKQNGIGYFGSAAVVARQNICTGNTKNGISVSAKAQPTRRVALPILTVRQAWRVPTPASATWVMVS
jgi:parallel beta-helix repeat protein